jgi:hypothetical protein
MMKPKRTTLLVGLMVALMFSTTGSAQLPRLDELMRQKLEHAQALLEAVVLADHVGIERYANELVLLSEASTWSPLQTPEYLHYSSDFREAAKALIDDARDRNIDGVSLAYMEMTLTCVQCHKHVRGGRRAD